MQFLNGLLLIAGLPSTLAHFILQVPPSIGFNDVNEVEAPCGGFDFNSREKVTDWPIGGHPVGVVSTHPNAHWQFRAFLPDAPETFVDLIPNIIQDGLGNFCVLSVPGYADWIGKDAVFQLIQTAVDGKLYQCAAVNFIEGPAAAVSGQCRNGTGIVASIDPEYSGTAMLPAPTSDSHSGDHSDHATSTGGDNTPLETGASGAAKLNISISGMLAMVIVTLDYFFN